MYTCHKLLKLIRGCAWVGVTMRKLISKLVWSFAKPLGVVDCASVRADEFVLKYTLADLQIRHRPMLGN